MGSPCEARFYVDDQNRFEKISTRIITEIDLLERRYSRFREDSLLSKINQIAREGGQFRADHEVSQLLNYADVCYRESEGLFDITTGVLRKTWNFKSGRLPAPGSVEKLLDKVGWNKLEWRAPLLSFPIPGMELDFGGIVKEYAADRCATLCLDLGLRHGLINLGGDIRIIGPHPDGEPWNIGIQNPYNPDENMLNLKLDRGGLASSGDYARCIQIGGKIYSHILNPKTGWPCQGLRAVTVVTDQCLTSGSVSTIAMLKGIEGKQWLQELGVDYVCMDTQGHLSGTLIS